MQAGAPTFGILHSRGSNVVSSVKSEIGCISGKVTGPQGEVATNALVELLEVGLQTYTDPEGTFEIRDVPLGTHTLRVIATGFRAKRQEIAITPGTTHHEVNMDPV